MEDQRVGTALRSIRIRRRLTQAALASRAGVSRDAVSAVERGRASSARIATLRAIAAALDARVVLTVPWQGGDLERMVNRRHAALHDVVARMFASMPGPSNPKCRPRSTESAASPTFSPGTLDLGLCWSSS